MTSYEVRVVEQKQTVVRAGAAAPSVFASGPTLVPRSDIRLRVEGHTAYEAKQAAKAALRELLEPQALRLISIVSTEKQGVVFIQAVVVQA